VRRPCHRPLLQLGRVASGRGAGGWACCWPQEFFLIDRDMYLQRPDLIACGRTLVGAAPPKGQALSDQYFADLSDKFLACVQDVEVELWKLGIPHTTRHREVRAPPPSPFPPPPPLCSDARAHPSPCGRPGAAFLLTVPVRLSPVVGVRARAVAPQVAPGQYEIAPLFTSSNAAVDFNVITMDVLNRVSRKHHLKSLLHEKPFAHLNGSGKHNNWSVGSNLTGTFFEPGPSECRRHPPPPPPSPFPPPPPSAAVSLLPRPLLCGGLDCPCPVCLCLCPPNVRTCPPRVPRPDQEPDLPGVHHCVCACGAPAR
jgi:hypothetical protein